MQSRIHALMTLALLACPACDDEYDDDLESRNIPMKPGTGAGTVFNTDQLESVALSELSQPLNGAPHIDLALDWVVLQQPGITVQSFHLDAGEIVAIDQYGAQHRGQALVNSVWHLSQNHWIQKVTLRIRALTLVEGVPHYWFEHATAGVWANNCPQETAHVPLARMLSGFDLDHTTGKIVADPTKAFIACTTAAVGKAAVWGYYDFNAEMSAPPSSPPPALPPIKGGIIELPGPGYEIVEPEQYDLVQPTKTEAIEPIEVSQPLSTFQPLALAIRVVRADYCYNGVSRTTKDIGIKVEDIWDIRNPDLNREIEAVWGADGLMCIGTPRHTNDIVTCPNRVIPACGDSSTDLADYPGGLMMTRIPWSDADELES